VFHRKINNKINIYASPFLAR